MAYFAFARFSCVLALALSGVHIGNAQAQAGSEAAEPIHTVSGVLTFVRDGNAQIAQLDGQPFDRLDAPRLTHFDDPSHTRVIVEGAASIALYDFRKKPPAVERIGRRLKLQSVYWQGDEVVLKTTDGWYRFQHGTLTALKSSKTIYH
jgi:hypothetical protein